jgi:hypothetical protein
MFPATNVVNASEMQDFFPYVVPTLHTYAKNSTEKLKAIYIAALELEQIVSDSTKKEIEDINNYNFLINRLYNYIIHSCKFEKNKGFYLGSKVTPQTLFIPFCSQETFENFINY